MIKILRWILLPFTLIYHLIIWLRNLLYDKQILKSYSFPIPTIVIGNLAIGGTGKTPLTEYLIDLLKTNYKVATLSRGYGRQSKGFRYVEENSTAALSGDEPLQFKKKQPEITVAVSEDRCAGVRILQHEHDVILLDDAYQHRKLKAGFNILLFDFNSLFKPILLLPTGNFRDIFSSTKRADLIIITKCPDHVSQENKAHIEHLVRKYNTCPIFYTSIAYSNPITSSGEYFNGNLEDMSVLLVTGIANPTPLYNYLKLKCSQVDLLKFQDHHNFTAKDYQSMLDRFNSISSSNKIIITTEKDMQRLDTTLLPNIPICYIPIKLQSADQQNITFDHFIENYIKSVK